MTPVVPSRISHYHSSIATMPANVTLNSWGDPIKTSNSSGEKVWGDVEATNDSSAPGGPFSSTSPSRPPASGRKNPAQYNGPDVKMTEREAAVFRRSYNAFKYACLTGAVIGGGTCWRMMVGRPIGRRLGLSVFSATLGSMAVPIAARPLIKFDYTKVEDPEHFKAAINTRARDLQREHMQKAGMSSAPNRQQQQQQQQQQGDDGFAGDYASQPSPPERQFESRSERTFDSQSQQTQPQPSSASSPTPAEDPFAASDGGNNSAGQGSNDSAPSGLPSSSRWAQIRGESAKPQSSWDRLREANR